MLSSLMFALPVRVDSAEHMDAFDADVLIYAAVAGHTMGRRVRALSQRNRSTIHGLVPDAARCCTSRSC